jgi:hypothetical protein
VRRWLALLLATGVASAVAVAAHAGPSASVDQAYARRILLKLSDFPAGWIALKNPGARGRCAKPSTVGLRVLVTLFSPKFERGATTAVSSRSYVLPTSAQAATLMRRWAALGYGACLRATLESAGTVSRLSSRPLAFGRLGRRTSARRVYLRFNAEGTSVDIYSDYVFVQKGRGVAGFNFVFSSKPPLSLERTLARKVAQRM